MEIIFGRENADQLREKYTVLDLETVTAEDGREMEVFCLVTVEKIGLEELPNLDSWVALHNEFLKGYADKQYDFCLQCIGHLMGKFGGELDSFYTVISDRISATTIDQPQGE